MSQSLCEYISVLKEATRLEHTISGQLDCLHEAISRLTDWKDDGCWELNIRQIDWNDVPNCDTILELVQAWRETQTQLATLEASLSEDERLEVL